MARKDDELLQTGRRPTLARNHQRGTPRIIWLAVLIGLVGAVLIFRSPGGGKPTGIGEQRSVITVPADDLDTLLTDIGIDEAQTGIETETTQPRSGNVEFQDIAPVVTPENPTQQAQPKTAPTSVPVTKPIVKPVTKPSRPKSVKKTQPEIQPAASGPYLVQSGSFGNPKNADSEAARLQTLGWDTRVKVSSTASGALVYRVRLGFFANRSQAEQFIHAHRKQLSGAIAVHR